MENMNSAPHKSIHPLMATAAVSVVVASLVGTAAMVGWIPKKEQAPALAPTAMAPLAAPATAPLVAQAAPAAPMAPAAQAQPVAKPAPQPVHKVVQAKPVRRDGLSDYERGYRQARYDEPSYEQREAHRRYEEQRRYDEQRRYEEQRYARQRYEQAQPNYVGMGTGAVLGGLIGNQVGGGNGKKLATVAGIIGGGYLGNQMIAPNR